MVDRGPAYALTGDYRGTKRDCDLVMKGGVTSGVIYPLAICKLAERYRFRSIGGASAGAIAAATTAAAEYARQTHADPSHGFKKLAALPDELGEPLASRRTRLASLFQPTDETKPAFNAALVALSDRHWIKKALAILLLATRAAPGFVLLGALLAIGALWLGSNEGLLGLAVAVSCALVVVAAGFAGSVLCAGRDAYAAVTANFGGLCLGYGTPAGDPPLITWLTDTLHAVAGVTAPLTFGQLAEQDIDLVMITTNLTHGRPHRIPFRTELLFFREDELAKLFPPAIIEALVDGGARALVDGDPERRGWLNEIAERNPGYVPVPNHADLPVAFAVRLSLSFPVLLSAVPLYTVDFSIPLERRKLERCWFSDGGICSNLPIHFFDRLLPTRPTFALDLRAPHPDHPITDGAPESKHVYLPRDNRGGITEQWRRSKVDGLPIATLVTSMIETMQCWNDNLLSHAPGFRDRIVHISHLPEEGGLNLEMPAKMITRLGHRGAAAGHKLIERFDEGDGWDNHLWIRYRTALGMLQQLFQCTFDDYFSTPSGRQAIDNLVAPDRKSYTLTFAERNAVAEVNATFARFSELSMPSFETNAPRPAAELRTRRRDS